MTGRLRPEGAEGEPWEKSDMLNDLIRLLEGERDKALAEEAEEWKATEFVTVGGPNFLAASQEEDKTIDALVEESRLLRAKLDACEPDAAAWREYQRNMVNPVPVAWRTSLLTSCGWIDGAPTPEELRECQQMRAGVRLAYEWPAAGAQDAKDAERYRWWRACGFFWRSGRCLQAMWPPGGEIRALEEGGPGADAVKWASIDAAVDAWMQAGAENKAHG